MGFKYTATNVENNYQTPSDYLYAIKAIKIT